MEKLNVIKEVRELKNQIAYSKNIGFFFGAGTSCALKIPDIGRLTSEVEAALKGDELAAFKAIQADLKGSGKSPSIEEVLNQIRRIREITYDSDKKDFLKITGELAKRLDVQICKQIYQIISSAEAKADLTSAIRFFAWLNILSLDYPKEIFTTNYDLIIEKSMEVGRIPFFDGFVGAYEPFFWQESIDQFAGPSDITRNWIRLWKIHGSLSWFWKKDVKGNSNQITRVGKFDKASYDDQELVIYPSKEKYDSSRKQPFVAYFDRLRNYLLAGELFFVFVGYSFSDQHINEIVFNCLRQNKRLFCVVLFYKDEEVEALYKTASSYMNLNVFGPTKAIVNGVLYDWEFDKSTIQEGEKVDLFFDAAAAKLILGDFNALVNFLISSSGKGDVTKVAKQDD